MPGIAGIISREPAADCRRRVARMLQTMIHEPFYTSGTCSAPDIGVYAGWVTLPSSFAAKQSGGDAGNQIDLAFAGECFQEESFSALYSRLGENCLAELNGLFSGLILDHSRGRALLFNDRYGIERIYVHETGEATYFASEAKALLAVLPALRSFDDRSVADFLTFGCPLAGRTLFRGIRTLEGGSLWAFHRGSCQKSRYFTPEQWERQVLLTPQAFDAEFQERFKKALPRYIGGDVPIGVSLTGGLDTRMIMAALPELASRPICYTFAGLEGETLDVRIAARVAAVCGLEHRVLRIGKDFLSDFGDYVDRTVYVTDGCAGAQGAHEIYLNAQARKLAPTRLTGNFGSEVLRSASTFKPLGLSVDLIGRDFRREIEATAGSVPASSRSGVKFAAFQEIPWSLFGTMAAAKSQVVFRTPYLDNDLVSIAYRASAAMRGSPGTALRFIRATNPSLSRIPTDKAVIPGGRGPAYALKRLFAEITFKLDYLHKDDLPRRLRALEGPIGAVGHAGLLGMHKYLPYRRWFRNELAHYVHGVLADSATRRLPYWNEAFLNTVARDHLSGRWNYVREINAVITLGAVRRLLFGFEPDQSVSPSAAHANLSEYLPR